MKHDDLWNDALEDAIPPELQTRHLAAMQSEAKRGRIRRCAVRASLSVILLSMLTWFALPKQERGIQPAALPAAPLEPKVRYLSDAELINRLQDTGTGVGGAGRGNDKQLVFVAHTGVVCQQ